MTDDRLRVLLCSSSMDGGGSERQLLYLLQGLDRDRFIPVLYLLYESGVLLDEVPADVQRIAFWSDYAFPTWNWPGRIHAMQVHHLARTIESQQIDVVYDRLFHMTLISGPATRRTKTPRISTIVSPPEFDLGRSEKRWRRLKRRTLAQAYQTSDSLLSVGAGTADNAAAYYGIPRHKFEVMVSPIDLERIDRESQLPWGGIPRRPGRKQIVSIGRLSDEKGHRYLIQAYASYMQESLIGRLPPADLHLIGDGVLRKELQSMAADLGVSESVFFHGQIPSPFAFLSQCDLFCLPSLYEGMPNVLLEAMACRVPILATDTPQGPGELLRANPLGTLVPRANAIAMAEAIRSRFMNPERWLSRLDAGRSHVERYHSLATWINRMSDVIVRTANRQHESRVHTLLTV